MIWILLAILGIPIWLIVVVLVSALRNRKILLSSHDVFVFKERKGDGWKRSKGRARWVSDVLIFHSGLALIRSDAVQVASVENLGSIDPPPKGLGDDPASLKLTFVDREPATVAVAAEDLGMALGPMAANGV